ncbi:UbiX family flavin prenyltransferase [Geopsychrobacter electrodiphilus]|uniref:UbiX family flavin prenyltransferase n=1 Tax=Geopsychrobacter electrodiphilus TaxID=225196 RepID=UPI00039A5A6D|nr:flavin prenyltransferase UbiX [Geopsychrobacter electrodiphilus]
MQRIVVGITGASGSIYGLRLIEELLHAQKEVSLLLTDAGRQVLAFETGLQLDVDPALCAKQFLLHYGAVGHLQNYRMDDFFAPIASGSSAPDAVVICPCSMGTLGRLAAGLSDNLLERVADVALKEQKKLLLVPRETPFNQLHLQNLLRVSQAGGQILPAMPAFYQKPQSVEELIDFVIGKILDQLGIEHALFTRWGD